LSTESEVVWEGRPWITPTLSIRTIAMFLVGLLLAVLMQGLGLLTRLMFGVPLYIWLGSLLALAWFASLASLLVLRASFDYVLRRNSIEINRGIASKKLLVVSASGFSELETDQGIVGRILNYGSVEVRSQGGQQLNLRLIRDPQGVSRSIRDVMTTPTVRISPDQPPNPVSKG
jgi:uncharacterized membrane protein YdbT with pleckstrin-like domain